MTMRSRLTRDAWMLLALSAGCSIDLSAHPAACDADADCSAGYTCYRQLCVMGYSPGDTGGGTGGDDAGGATAGDGDGDGTGGVAGDGDGDGTGGITGDGDGDAIPDSGMGGNGGTGGMQATVPDYSPCADEADCNPGDECRSTIAGGVCSAPCANDNECTTPPGDFDATAECTSGRCRLNCAAVSVPPRMRDCPSGLACKNEIPLFTCYPE